MADIFYQDDLVTLYHGDCREVTAWLEADVMVTDPPYGRAWKQGRVEGKGAGRTAGDRSDPNPGIANDLTTDIRDKALEAWGKRPAVMFGDLMLPPPVGVKLVGVYKKPNDAGMRGAVAGVRRDTEALYWLGSWPTGLGGRSSIFTTSAPTVGGPYGIAARAGGHPHAKPLDTLEELIAACPPGIVADPFAGSGSTLMAAKCVGRRAVGVELEERYCEIAAKRLTQDTLFGGVA